MILAFLTDQPIPQFGTHLTHDAALNLHKICCFISDLLCSKNSCSPVINFN